MTDTYELAGSRAVTEITPEGTMTVTFSDEGTGRTCGSGSSRCMLCCKLLPIAEVRKPANTRCRHQSQAKGCQIYKTRPFSCQVFSCRWLADPTTKNLPRPDRAHYVIDLQPEYVEMVDRATGAIQKVSVFQVWVDPAFPEAHRAPALREWMHEMARLHMAATVVRWSPTKGICVFPPPFDPVNGAWNEMAGPPRVTTREEAEIASGFKFEIGVVP